MWGKYGGRALLVRRGSKVVCGFSERRKKRKETKDDSYCGGSKREKPRSCADFTTSRKFGRVGIRGSVVPRIGPGQKAEFLPAVAVFGAKRGGAFRLWLRAKGLAELYPMTERFGAPVNVRVNTYRGGVKSVQDWPRRESTKTSAEHIADRGNEYAEKSFGRSGIRRDAVGFRGRNGTDDHE